MVHIIQAKYLGTRISLVFRRTFINGLNKVFNYQRQLGGHKSQKSIADSVIAESKRRRSKLDFLGDPSISTTVTDLWSKIVQGSQKRRVTRGEALPGRDISRGAVVAYTGGNPRPPRPLFDNTPQTNKDENRCDDEYRVKIHRSRCHYSETVSSNMLGRPF